jgi:hypothetical protein
MAGYYRQTMPNIPMDFAPQQNTQLMMQASMMATQQVQQAQQIEDHYNELLMQTVSNADPAFRDAIREKLDPYNQQIEQYAELFNQGNYQAYRKQTPQGLRQIGKQLTNEMMSTEVGSLGHHVRGSQQLQAFWKSFEEKNVDPSLRSIAMQSYTDGKLKGMIDDYISGKSSSLNLPNAPEFFDKKAELLKLLKDRGLDERQIEAVVNSDLPGYLKTQTTSTKFVPPEELALIIQSVWDDPRNQAVEHFHQMIGSDYNPIAMDGLGNMMYEATSQSIVNGMNEFASSMGYESFADVERKLQEKYLPKLQAATTEAQAQKIAQEMQTEMLPFIQKQQELQLTSNPNNAVSSANQRYRAWQQLGTALSPVQQTQKSDYKSDVIAADARRHNNAVRLAQFRAGITAQQKFNEEALKGTIQIHPNGTVTREVEIPNAVDAQSNPVYDSNRPERTENRIVGQVDENGVFHPVITGTSHIPVSGSVGTQSTGQGATTGQSTGGTATGRTTPNQTGFAPLSAVNTPAAIARQPVGEEVMLPYLTFNPLEDNYIQIQARRAEDERIIESLMEKENLTEPEKITLVDAYSRYKMDITTIQTMLDYDNQNNNKNISDIRTKIKDEASRYIGNFTSHRYNPISFLNPIGAIIQASKILKPTQLDDSKKQEFLNEVNEYYTDERIRDIILGSSQPYKVNESQSGFWSSVGQFSSNLWDQFKDVFKNPTGEIKTYPLIGSYNEDTQNFFDRTNNVIRNYGYDFIKEANRNTYGNLDQGDKESAVRSVENPLFADYFKARYESKTNAPNVTLSNEQLTNLLSQIVLYTSQLPNNGVTITGSEGGVLYLSNYDTIDGLLSSSDGHKFTKTVSEGGYLPDNLKSSIRLNPNGDGYIINIPLSNGIPLKIKKDIVGNKGNITDKTFKKVDELSIRMDIPINAENVIFSILEIVGQNSNIQWNNDSLLEQQINHNLFSIPHSLPQTSSVTGQSGVLFISRDKINSTADVIFESKCRWSNGRKVYDITGNYINGTKIIPFLFLGNQERITIPEGFVQQSNDVSIPSHEFLLELIKQSIR